MSSLLFLLLTSVVVDVSLSNGEQVSGQLQSLAGDGVTVEVAGEARRIARGGVKNVRFPSVEKTNDATLFVQLTDDSVLPCSNVALVDGVLKAGTGSSDWTTKSEKIRAIRWQTAGEKTDEQWNEILSQPATEDLLVIRRDAGLDYLKGVVVGVSKETVQFEYSGNTIPVPLARVAGVILARKEAERPSPRLQMTTHDGGQWMLKSVEMRDSRIALVTMADVRREILVEDVSKIVYPQLGAVFLTDVEPTQVNYQPFFASKLNKTLEALHAPQFDVSYDGDALRVASKQNATGWRQFRRGLAVQSRTELVYRLAGKYQRFMATAGVGPDSPSQADVELKLFSDDREIFSAKIANSDEPIEIDVDVSSARRLKLLVDYGENIHIGDRIHLGDARLIK